MINFIYAKIWNPIVVIFDMHYLLLFSILTIPSVLVCKCAADHGS